MRVKELELKDNARLMIRGTKKISLIFTEIHQLVIGTNGCGKSTLIQELSPLPPSGNDYLKDGYKKIVIDHDNVDYTLTSIYSVKAGKHSFINNATGEELNSGGTQSVQRTLVKEIFNYDQSLHDVLTDQIKFTNMSPLQRRDWLTRMSGTNLDYAIELFNKLRRSQRDEEAVVKHLTSRLNKESDGLPTIQEIHELESRFNNFDKLVKSLYSERVSQNMPLPEKMFELFKEAVDQSIELSKQVLRIDNNLIDKNIDSVDKLTDVISRLRHQMEIDNNSVITLYNEHQEISGLLNQTQNINDEEHLDSLKKDLETLHLEIEDLKSKTVLVKQCDNASLIYGRARGISDAIYHVATEFIDNTEGYFTKAKLAENQTIVDGYNLQLNNLSRELTKVEHSISHITRSDDVVCPKCNHTFIPGISESDLPRLKEMQSSLEIKIDEVQKKRNVHSAYVDEYYIYRDNYIRYMNILNGNKDLEFLNTFIRPIDLLKDSPTLISTTFARCLADLDLLAKIERELPVIYRLEAAIAKVNSVRSNGNYTQDRLNKIDSDIAILRTNQRDNEYLLKQYEQSHRNYQALVSAYNNLNTKLNDLSKTIEYYYLSNKKEAIETTITKVNTDLAHVNIQLNQARNKQGVIDDISSQRDKTLARSNGFKTLVNEINPTSGLIADYFKQFIDQFVEQMNIIINKVWEHHIELLPCDVNSDGISYKFPLRINDKPYGPPDGSKGSNSQVSMVNFAFKIVVMVYLGLDDYPLFLDELAPDLDEKHRINIISFVRSFVESGRCSQMYLVSHYASGYGAFTNAEILVLDDENLLNIPATYNEHVEIIKDESVSLEES